MPKRPTFNELQQFGFRLSVPGAVPPRGWIEGGNLDMLANDAALVTIPNTAIPAELTA